MEYINPESMKKDDLETEFNSNDVERIAKALINATNYSDDWGFAQGWCLHFLSKNDPSLARIGAIGLADIERVHGNIEYDTVIARLKERAEQNGTDEELRFLIAYCIREIEHGRALSSDA